MNLLRYNVAMSLDGFIAGPNGEFDWLPKNPDVDFKALFSEFDSFIMGRKTFEIVEAQGDLNPTKGSNVFVISTTLDQASTPGVVIVKDSIPERVRAIKANTIKDVWLFGGGSLFRYLLDLGLVDRVEIAVIPILLGGGIRLITEGSSHTLTLMNHISSPSGIVQLVYSTSPAWGC